MGMGWNVRAYRDGDFPAVWALERARDPEGYASAVWLRQAAALWPETFLVAEESGELAGFVIGAASSDPAVGWVLRLKVREGCRRQGCATALLDVLLERLRSAGATTFLLTVAPANAEAIALYAGLGFSGEAVLPAYFGPGEDRLLLRLRT
jgi:ribosomal protein S18 acetylase RimI-like enzyme